MKSTQSNKQLKDYSLAELKKLPNKFYKELGIVTPGGLTTEKLKYIVKRSVEALPAKIKKFIDDKEQKIDTTVHMIIAMGEEGQMEPYKAFYQHSQTIRRQKNIGTLEETYRRFRTETPQVYNHYNTYVYRLGFSAKQWYMDNAQVKTDKGITIITVDLPDKARGKKYEYLEISYDWSSGDFDAEMQEFLDIY